MGGAGRGRSFAEAFTGRDNGLNLIRLALALSVIAWHCFPAAGRVAPLGLGNGRLGDIGVDGFFLLSGFLVTRSWTRTPDALTFLRHRALRIVPAFWVCLLVTAFVAAPIAWLYQTGSPRGYSHQGPLGYLTHNVALRMGQYRIGTTPSDVPYTYAWNASLWTLAWEATCYGGVLLLGVAGLLRRRGAAVLGLFALGWAVTILQWADIDAAAALALGSDQFLNAYRFMLLFSAGALLWLFADRIPDSKRLAAAAALVTLASLIATTHYRAIAALPFGYVLIWTAINLPRPLRRIGATNDLSYGVYIYGFQVQQLLAVIGVARHGFVPFFTASVTLTFPVAAASWFLVERPALRLKDAPWRPGGVPAGSPDRSAAAAGGAGASRPDSSRFRGA